MLSPCILHRLDQILPVSCSVETAVGCQDVMLSSTAIQCSMGDDVCYQVCNVVYIATLFYNLSNQKQSKIIHLTIWRC